MSNAAVFLNSPDVNVAAAGALSGDGSIGDPLAVNVDGVTITVNGSNELEGAAINATDTQLVFIDGSDASGNAALTFHKTTHVLQIVTAAGSAGSNPQALTVLGVNAAPLVPVGDGVDPAAIVALKTPTAADGGGAQFGVISTDYSTDPSDAMVLKQDSGGASTIGVGYGGNGQHVVAMTFDHRTASNDTAVGIYPNGGSSPVVQISRAGALTVPSSVTASAGVIFPTSDPMIVGAWWNNMGVLTISAA